MSLPTSEQPDLLWFSQISSDDKSVGRKALRLSILKKASFSVPNGFIVPSKIFKAVLQHNQTYSKIVHQIESIDPFNPGDVSIASQRIIELIKRAEIKKEFAMQIFSAYSHLGNNYVAIRTSISDDKKKGIDHHKPFFNVYGDANVLEHIKISWANVFNSKYISQLARQKADLSQLEVSIIVEEMVKTEFSGYAHSQNLSGGDKESAIVQAIKGTNSKNSGEYDIYYVDRKNWKITQKQISRFSETTSEHSPSQVITDDQIRIIVKQSVEIQKMFYYPQKIEWIISKNTLYVLDTQDINHSDSIRGKPSTTQPSSIFLGRKKIAQGECLVGGVVTGPIRTLSNKNSHSIKKGDIVQVKDLKDVKQIPLKNAAGIILIASSPVSREAIYLKELGFPVVLLDQKISTKDSQIVTLNASQGELYLGSYPAKFIDNQIDSNKSKTSHQKTVSKMYINVNSTQVAKTINSDQIDGIGILRGEFVFKDLGIHPKELIETKKTDEVVSQLSSVLTQISAQAKDKPVLYRLTDFTTQTAQSLAGAKYHESNELNPLVGLRGVSRHIARPDVLKIEIESFLKAKRESSFNNLHLLLPFVRSVTELARIKRVLSGLGFSRSSNSQLWSMVEVPAFCDQLDSAIEMGLDGFIIGINDLTMLTFGVNRDSQEFYDYFNQPQPVIQQRILQVLNLVQSRLPVILSVEGAQIHPDIIESSVREGITGFSVDPSHLSLVRGYAYSSENKIINPASNSNYV